MCLIVMSYFKNTYYEYLVKTKIIFILKKLITILGINKICTTIKYVLIKTNYKKSFRNTTNIVVYYNINCNIIVIFQYCKYCSGFQPF